MYEIIYSKDFHQQYKELRGSLLENDCKVLTARLESTIVSIRERGPFGDKSSCLAGVTENKELYTIYESCLLDNNNDKISLYSAQGRTKKEIIILDIGLPEEKTRKLTPSPLPVSLGD